MMTEQEKYEWIEAYLDNTLTDEQRISFARMLEEDPDFQKEIDQHRELQESLAPSSFDAFRQVNLKVLEENRPSPNINRFQARSWWGIAAGLAAIIAATLWGVLPSQPNTDRIFSQYYETPTRLGLTRTDLRSSPDPALQIQVSIDSLYQHGAYQAALSLLSSQGHQLVAFESSDYYYWLGILYLEVGQPEQAIANLEQVQVGHTDEKKWYLSLALLKSGRLQEAEDRLSDITATNGPYRKEASQLLQDLR